MVVLSSIALICVLIYMEPHQRAIVYVVCLFVLLCCCCFFNSFISTSMPPLIIKCVEFVGKYIINKEIIKIQKTKNKQINKLIN